MSISKKSTEAGYQQVSGELGKLAAPAPHVAYIGVGANLGDAVATIQRALQELQCTRGIIDCVTASLYRTAPINASGPDYINTVARLRTSLDPYTLLDTLQALEHAHGRTRPYRNAPRTLDLDILLYDNDVIESERLQVPHPRMHERAFVLVPLAQLTPTLTLKQGRVADLARQLEHEQAIARLAGT